MILAKLAGDPGCEHLGAARFQALDQLTNRHTGC
jgi:hypothetical protein